MKLRTKTSARDTLGGDVPNRDGRNPAAPGRVFRFAYYCPPKEDEVGLPELRDSDAFVELSPLLYPQYSYGGLVLNYPAPKKHDPDVVIRIDESFLTPSDLLVLSTRPPLDDTDIQIKFIRRSYTSLERKVLKAVGTCFSKCSRPFVELPQRLREAFPDDKANRAYAEYRMYGGFAFYKNLRDFKRGRWEKCNATRTGAYLLYKKPAWPGGPGLLVAFGMNGTQTLLWSHFLGTRPEFSKILTHSRFLMAEIEHQDLPKRPESLRFSDSWRVETLLDYPLDQPAQRRR